jgi:hypothetical protein
LAASVIGERTGAEFVTKPTKTSFSSLMWRRASALRDRESIIFVRILAERVTTVDFAPPLFDHLPKEQTDAENHAVPVVRRQG